MKVVPANISPEGAELVYSLKDSPTNLNSAIGTNTYGFAGFDQFFIPGISVPGYDYLDLPFNVPVLGDDDPVSLMIDTPHMESSYVARVTFMGKLIAEFIEIHEPEIDRMPFIDFLDDPTSYIVDEAFDDLCEFGGFLRASVTSYHTGIAKYGLHHVDDLLEQPITLQAEAELYLFDDEQEFDHVNALLRSGDITPFDLYGHLNYDRINSLLQSP